MEDKNLIEEVEKIKKIIIIKMLGNQRFPAPTLLDIKKLMY